MIGLDLTTGTDATVVVVVSGSTRYLIVTPDTTDPTSTGTTISTAGSRISLGGELSISSAWFDELSSWDFALGDRRAANDPWWGDFRRHARPTMREPAMRVERPRRAQARGCAQDRRRHKRKRFLEGLRSC